MTQQASGYSVRRGKFFILERPVLAAIEFENKLQNVNSVKGAVRTELASSLIRSAQVFEVTLESASLAQQEAHDKEDSVHRSHIAESIDNFEPDDWRIPLVNYLKNPGQTRDRKIRRQALKYVLLDDELYRRRIDGLLLKCLGSDQSRVAMGEVHEGICGTHQSAHKMRWLLKRAGFYWPTMLDNCFRYYKGCEACQKFGNI